MGQRVMHLISKIKKWANRTEGRDTPHDDYYGHHRYANAKGERSVWNYIIYKLQAAVLKCQVTNCRETDYAANIKNYTIDAKSPFRQLLVDRPIRSEEHTSELQSLRHLVCRLLL